MYGLVNRAIEQLVTAQAGAAAWARVARRAGAPEGGFVSMCPYHDELTDRLVDAVSEELGLPRAQVLEVFGEYWVLYTAEEGYGPLLDDAGGGLRGFLDTVDDMHVRVGHVFPSMIPPRLRVEPDPSDEAAFRLVYESERQGLAPMVVGLVRGLARRFDREVEVEQVQWRGPHASCDAFRIRERPLRAEVT